MRRALLFSINIKLEIYFVQFTLLQEIALKREICHAILCLLHVLPWILFSLPHSLFFLRLPHLKSFPQVSINLNSSSPHGFSATHGE